MVLRHLLVSLLIISLSNIHAQDFQFHSTFPFGIQLVDSTGERIVFKLMFIDRDQDGDQDLFLTSLGLGESEELDLTELTYNIEYQENIGTAKEPEFGQIAPAFDTLYIPFGYFYPSCGDLNGDGIPDFIAMAEEEYISEIQHLLFYISSGDTFDIKRDFDFDLNPIVPLSRLLPSLADLDADGDLDIVLCGTVTSDLADTTQEFRVLYAKNIGDKSNPEFLGWFNNPYDIVQDTSGEFIQMADIDLDGDMDAIS
ncbi:MAG: hypothetical protein HKN68_00155, partial [Saprospiraceae bacterium]|nr:hypothetical protein [Saprospiraceae bacterium]